MGRREAPLTPAAEGATSLEMLSHWLSTASFQHFLASPFPSLPLAWPGRDSHLLFPHDTAAFPLTLSFYLKS